MSGAAHNNHGQQTSYNPYQPNPYAPQAQSFQQPQYGYNQQYNVGQHQQAPMPGYQVPTFPSYQYGHPATSPAAASFNNPPQYYAPAQSSWDMLISPSTNQPTPLFSRFIDTLFNHFNDPGSAGFDPIKYASVFTQLMYPDNENKPRYFFIFATQNNFRNPEAFVYDILPMYYRCFGIAHVMQNGRPVLTREGFATIMLRDSLGDPDVQCRRFNHFLTNQGRGALMNPVGGGSFPPLPIARNAFPAGQDPGTIQQAKDMNEAFNREMSAYLKNMSKMQQWMHNVTSDAIDDLDMYWRRTWVVSYR